MVARITFAPGDAPLAERLQYDLKDAEDNILIAVLSPEAVSNGDVQKAIERSLDAGQHIVVVLAKSAPLPKLIDHVSVVDFTQAYKLDGLKDTLAHLSGPNAPRPMRVLTPTIRRANRRVAYWLLAAAIFWFIVGIVFVMSGGKMPKSEYDAVDTSAAQQVEMIIGRNVPHSTAEAEHFPQTLQAAPTRQIPFLIGTVTAQAAGTYMPSLLPIETATPTG
jgi:hypothetical protein